MEPAPLIEPMYYNILGELWLFYREEAGEDETWTEFFQWADIGLPLAYILREELVLPKPESIKYIQETWERFCEIINIDPDGGYEDLAECFESSPNSLLNVNQD